MSIPPVPKNPFPVSCGNTTCTFAELLGKGLAIINTVIPLLISVVVLFFIWKVVDAWVINGGDETKVAEGKQTALIGVVVLVVMLTVWGIVAFLRQGIFG